MSKGYTMMNIAGIEYACEIEEGKKATPHSLKKAIPELIEMVLRRVNNCFLGRSAGLIEPTKNKIDELQKVISAYNNRKSLYERSLKYKRKFTEMMDFYDHEYCSDARDEFVALYDKIDRLEVKMSSKLNEESDYYSSIEGQINSLIANLHMMDVACDIMLTSKEISCVEENRVMPLVRKFRRLLKDYLRTYDIIAGGDKVANVVDGINQADLVYEQKNITVIFSILKNS